MQEAGEEEHYLQQMDGIQLRVREEQVVVELVHRMEQRQLQEQLI